MTNWTGPLKAEWLKIKRNYRIITFLVWILPVGMFTFYSIMIIGGLLLDAPPEELTFGCAGQWTDRVYGIWNFLTANEGSIFGRILPLAFFALVFAGEYQWGTWKNLVPLNRRLVLLLSKGTVAALTVTLSVLITAPISAGGQALLCKIGGANFGPALSGVVVLDFFRDFALSSLIGILVLLLILGFTTLTSILSRSVLAGFLGGFVLSLLEILSSGILALLGNIFKNPDIVNLTRFTPGFNIENLKMWFFQNQAYQGELIGTAVDFSVWQSLAVLGFWILITFGLAVIIFQRQDLIS